MAKKPLDDRVAIRIDGIKKSFRLPHNRQNSLKSAAINLISGGDRSYEVQQVLKGISFDIRKGDFFGIVGKNGSGKSTLLKLISGIYNPTEGKITIDGSLTPFIELGVGFNPELTGRENVYLNGALLGFSNAEVNDIYNDIVAFAELDRFMDQKLKNYSSGMQVRLAFSIAIRARSDILLLDEVLAVGDEAFQRKCYEYFDQLKESGKTVILVSHDMATVERFCNRAILLEDGVIKVDGLPREAAMAYTRSNQLQYDQEAAKVGGDGHDTLRLGIMNASGQPATIFSYLDKLTLKISWTYSGVRHVGIALYKSGGELVFGLDTLHDKYELGSQKKVGYTITLNLSEGDYYFKTALLAKDAQTVIVSSDEKTHFSVKKDYEYAGWSGVTKLEHTWLQ